MAQIAFETLWNNHPMNQSPPIQAPCSGPDGQRYYDNQCAIKMGECFDRSGLTLHGFHGVFCWHKHERRHPLRADQLGKMATQPSQFPAVR
jgi:hypothetical protein